MNSHIQPALASIVVPCFNQLEFTQLCVQALFRHSRRTWELIVIDNGSTDDTAVYLAGVRDAASVPVTVVKNAQNRGFPAAVNQGLRQAQGEYLVLLNNDAVVTDGWLDQLVALTRVDVHSDWETSGPEGGGDPSGARRPALNQDSAEADSRPPLTPTSQGGESSANRRPPFGPSIGLVGPMSNYATPPQLVENVPYRDLDEMQAFARRWRDEHRGKWFTVPKLSGFCMMMTRAVYESIGGLDERFGLGLFDDDDLAERARRAGFALAVARDLFIHHYGSRTFVGNGIDAESLLDENARRFAAKWGQDRPRGRRVALRTWPHSIPETKSQIPDSETKSQIPDSETESQIPDSECELPDSGSSSTVGSRSLDSGALPRVQAATQRTPDTGHRTRISLTMIVRDEEKNLPQCLESVRGVFDEVVVVDTGSNDRTVEIAQEFGARVFEFTWIDDFAAARNEALAHATGDYAFWLDADDVVDSPERVKLQKLLDGLRPDEPAGYVVRCACDPSADGSGGDTVVDHVRLFPIRDNIRWTYRVHEQIMPALRRAGIPVRWTDLVVRHTGYVNLALRARKLERDTRILREELKHRPDEPFLLFNLGSIAIEQRDSRGRWNPYARAWPDRHPVTRSRGSCSP